MLRQVANRTLLGLVAIIFAFWVSGMLFGALYNVIHPGTTYSGCRICAHWK